MAKREHESRYGAAFAGAIHNRRQFLQATSAAALSAMVPARFALGFAGGGGAEINPHLLPSSDQIWGSLEAMNRLGPRFTGNDAHRKFVDMLESGMREAGLQTARDSYTFPRWEAKKWSLSVTPKSAGPIELPVAFYYPHSGQTGPQGITGPLVYVGKIVSDGSGKPDLSGDLKDKIVLVDYEIAPRDYNEWYTEWGSYRPGVKLEKYITSTIAVEMGLLTDYKKAGAAGVIVCWSNLSEGQSDGQNMPFGRPIQDIPALMVGRESGSKLRRMAAEGATAKLVLDAQVFPNSGTDSLLATLPGASNDEALIVYTHTDGPNAIQENAGVMLVALAKYFSRLPQGSRKRTLVFSLVSGHDNGAYVPGKQGGFLERHPDIVKKTVASVAVEHLGCREWRDDEAHVQYRATGEDEMTYAITNHQTLADLELASAQGTAERRVAAVKPTPQGRYLGVGGSLAATGMPTLGYYASPTYLNIVAADGCISKLSQPLMYGQVTALAKLLHKLDAVQPSDLKWLPASRRSRETSG